MKINLKDKKALIGGSSKGLGYAVAKQLAVCGAMVTLVSRNEPLLKKNMIIAKNIITNFLHWSDHSPFHSTSFPHGFRS